MMRLHAPSPTPPASPRLRHKVGSHVGGPGLPCTFTNFTLHSYNNWWTADASCRPVLSLLPLLSGLQTAGLPRNPLCDISNCTLTLAEMMELQKQYTLIFPAGAMVRATVVVAAQLRA